MDPVFVPYWFSQPQSILQTTTTNRIGVEILEFTSTLTIPKQTTSISDDLTTTSVNSEVLPFHSLRSIYDYIIPAMQTKYETDVSIADVNLIIEELIASQRLVQFSNLTFLSAQTYDLFKLGYLTGVVDQKSLELYVQTSDSPSGSLHHMNDMTNDNHDDPALNFDGDSVLNSFMVKKK